MGSQISNQITSEEYDAKVAELAKINDDLEEQVKVVDEKNAVAKAQLEKNVQDCGDNLQPALQELRELRKRVAEKDDEASKIRVCRIDEMINQTVDGLERMQKQKDAFLASLPPPMKMMRFEAAMLATAAKPAIAANPATAATAQEPAMAAMAAKPATAAMPAIAANPATAATAQKPAMAALGAKPATAAKPVTAEKPATEAKPAKATKDDNE